MIRVKICGITTVEDARLAVDLGASAIGMVCWPREPARVSTSRARAIVAALPPFVTAVGVFVDQTGDAVRDRAGCRPVAPCSSMATSRRSRIATVLIT